MGSLQILNAIKAKVEVPKTEKRGRLYVETKVSNQVVKTLVDTKASNIQGVSSSPTYIVNIIYSLHEYWFVLLFLCLN